VRPPRGLHDRILQVDRAVEQLWAELGRSPTPREVARTVDCSLEDVMEAFEASAAAREPASLDAPQGAEPDAAPVAEGIGAEDAGYALVEHRATLDVLLRRLPRRERQILRLRFADGLTQQEIGARVGLSQMHVSRLLRRTLQTLREEALAKDGA
jgi:RNA polymerase sigma-B factor